MKNTVLIILILVILVILSTVLFFTKTKATILNKHAMNDSTEQISLNTPFEMLPGESIEVEELTLSYDNLQLPPTSFQGNKDEYTYPQLTATEKEDEFHFAVNSQSDSQYYHDYLIKLLERDGEKIKISIEKTPSTNKVPEYVAVQKALKVAEEANAPMPEARVRILEKNIWKIEVSLGPTDSYMMVEINANTGEVVNITRQNRA
ncbi:MAG: hypothetical protein WC095_00365 [Candidatus Paceibacterota bacterium]